MAMVCEGRGDTHELAREQPAAEWAVRDERDAELLARVADPDLWVLDTEREGGILELSSCHRVHGVRAAEGVVLVLDSGAKLEERKVVLESVGTGAFVLG